MHKVCQSGSFLICCSSNVGLPGRFDEAIRHVEGSSVYVGFDPTADSLHIGNLVTIMAMLHFQRAGYQPLAVVGLSIVSKCESERVTLSLYRWAELLGSLETPVDEPQRGNHSAYTLLSEMCLVYVPLSRKYFGMRAICFGHLRL